MAGIAVEREDDGLRGRYFFRFEDGTEGEMTYRHVAPDVIAADHTGVPRHHRGKGHAEQIVAAAMTDARRDGFRIIPLCSYVDAQFRRHPEWADLRAD